MSYRNILVQVDTTSVGRTRIAAAAHVAKKFGAGLTGAFLKAERIPNYVIGDGMVVPSVNVEEYLEERAGENARASADSRAVFQEVASPSGVPLKWVELNADNDNPLAACARRHDLTVLPATMNATFADHTISAASIGMACGGPLLVIPERGFPADFGGRILIAWNDSRESARAMKDALPFLKQATSIHFLSVGEQDEKELDPMLQDFLVGHGCANAKLVVDHNEDVSTAYLIRRQIDMVGADMVILGLYGHSRLQELVLGGVSRTLLGKLAMPLLVSH
jgi:nucleotide-binding universal stress UspA family protein